MRPAERKQPPMHRKLIATLSLVALLGCSEVPPLSSPRTPETNSQGLKVQGIVSATVESAEIVPSTSRALQTDARPLSAIRLLPIAAADTLPAGSEPVFLKRFDDDESHYEVTASEAEATMIGVSAQIQEDLHPQMRATLGSTPARSISRIQETRYEFSFPQEAVGALTISFPSGSDLYLADQLPADEPEGPLRWACISSYTVPPDRITYLSDLKDATITFKVTDAQGQAVLGIPPEYFVLTLSDLSEKKDKSDPRDVPRPFQEFAELGNGKYRITSLFAPRTETGKLTFTVEVANPSQTSEASFYRR